mmetsp:Transcript_18143/g.45114  ORF Transcript_18143/g.45114 Transcript_18143/m.45114 type:complete len:300 (-) Transcript_18143:144-1043(-)
MAVVTHTFQTVLCFVLSQASVVHHDGMESISDGLSHEDGSYGRINTTTHGSHHVAVSNLFANVCNEFLCVICHHPILLGTSNLNAEILQNVFPERRVSDFRMELQSPHALFQVLDCHEFSVVGPGNWRKAFRSLGQFVSVRHPHLEFFWHSIENLRLASFDTLDNRLSILVFETRGNFSSKHVGQFLHSIANSKHRKVSFRNKLPNSFRNVGGTFVVDTRGSAAQDNGDQLMLSKFFGRYLARIQFAIHVQFTNAASNQVGILRSEIQNRNLRPRVVAQARRLFKDVTVCHLDFFSLDI